MKWNKQTFNDFEVDPANGVELMKGQLFAVTNVPVDKQKLMFKGKILKVSDYHSGEYVWLTFENLRTTPIYALWA